MLIELKDLEINPVDFREEYGPGVIDLGTEVVQRSPLFAEGRADLAYRRAQGWRGLRFRPRYRHRHPRRVAPAHL